MPVRHFVFLQGMPSPFIRRVGRLLLEKGCRVTRINFCVGDWLYWHGQNTLSYRGRYAKWERFIGEFFDRNAVTDLVLLGEQRRYHKEAVVLAQARGIRVTVNDFGYLRPDWITFESDGMGGNSSLPRDPKEIVRRAAGLAKADLGNCYADSSLGMASRDLLYNFSNLFLGWLYPRYRRTDRRPHTLIYTLGSAKHLLLSSLRANRNAAKVKEIARSNSGYFVLPLQLDHDFQIVAYSKFNGMEDVIRLIIGSFSRSANSDVKLIIKVHPWDAGLKNWRRKIKGLASEFLVADRVEYLDGGNLDDLVQHALGLVTVNSTAGLHALQMSCPVITLGQAVYDVPDLTFQGELDEFWKRPSRPDTQLLEAFINLMVATTQIRGVFFSEPGCTAAVGSAVRRLLANHLALQ